MERWQRDYDRMLAAGPPEEPTHTISYSTDVLIESTGSALTDVLEHLRTVLGPDTTVEIRHDEEDGEHRLHIEGDIEDVRDSDEAADVIAQLINTAPHALVLDDFTATPPGEDEVDWDSIAKDRRLEEDDA